MCVFVCTCLCLLLSVCGCVGASNSPYIINKMRPFSKLVYITKCLIHLSLRSKSFLFLMRLGLILYRVLQYFSTAYIITIFNCSKTIFCHSDNIGRPKSCDTIIEMYAILPSPNCVQSDVTKKRSLINSVDLVNYMYN